MLGIAEDNTSFDTDIIAHINSTFLILNQLGVGPSSGFRIQDNTNTWDDFVKDNIQLNAVETYIYLKVKLVFDPPASSAVMEANKQMINELEWRLNTEAETESN